MTGLIYKDIVVLKKQLGYYMIFLVFYAAMAVMGMGAGIFGAMISLVGLVLPMSSIAYDEQARWDKFAVSTPAGRAGVVGAKYLFTLAVVGGMTAVVVAMMGALRLAGLLKESVAELALTALACAGAVLFMNSFTLPLLLKYGAEKSRSISMGLFVIIFGGAFLGGMVLKSWGSLPAPPIWLLRALPGLLVLLVAGAFGASYCIARGIYEKKEL